MQCIISLQIVTGQMRKVMLHSFTYNNGLGKHNDGGM